MLFTLLHYTTPQSFHSMQHYKAHTYSYTACISFSFSFSIFLHRMIYDTRALALAFYPSVHFEYFIVYFIQTQIYISSCTARTTTMNYLTCRFTLEFYPRRMQNNSKTVFKPQSFLTQRNFDIL